MGEMDMCTIRQQSCTTEQICTDIDTHIRMNHNNGNAERNKDMEMSKVKSRQIYEIFGVRHNSRLLTLLISISLFLCYEIFGGETQIGNTKSSGVRHKYEIFGVRHKYEIRNLRGWDTNTKYEIFGVRHNSFQDTRHAQEVTSCAWAAVSGYLPFYQCSCDW